MTMVLWPVLAFVALLQQSPLQAQGVFSESFMQDLLDEVVCPPEHCRANPTMDNWRPAGCWYNEGDAESPLYTSCVFENLYEFGARHVFRRFSAEEEKRGRGSPNSASSACEHIPINATPPESVTCAITLSTEDGWDVEKIVYVRCQTWVGCGHRASGECCSYLFEEPGAECIRGNRLDSTAFPDKLDEQCYWIK